MIRTLRAALYAAVAIGGSELSTLNAAQPAAGGLLYPLTSAVSSEGAVYISDRRLPGVWKVADGKAALFHQGSKKFRTPLNAIWCVAFDSKSRLVAGDSATRDVYRFDKDGKPIPLTKGAIGIPISIASDGKGTLYVSDLETHRIWKVSEEGGKPEEFAAISGPRGLTVDDKGNVWVVNASRNQLIRFSPDGKPKAVVTGRPFRFPHCVAVGKDGTAYVSDGYAKCVWKVVSGSKPEQLASGAPFVNPVGLTWLNEKLLVTDSRANAVFTVTLDGKVTKLVGGPASKK